MQKLWTPPAAIFVEKKFEKSFGEVLDLSELPHERNWYFEKNGILKFFEGVRNPEPGFMLSISNALALTMLYKWNWNRDLDLTVKN